MNLAALMSRRFMVVWVAWVVLAVAYTVWIFESPDSKGANSPLMIVLMCILVAVPIIALFVGNRMVKKLFPPPSHHTYRRDSVIDMEEGREDGGSGARRYGSIDTIMQDFISDGFFKAWDYWVKDNTTTSTITDINADDDISSSSEKYEEPCAICLSDYQVGEVVRELPCGHRFHTCCFDNCFSSRPRGFKLHHVCPLCRAPLGPTSADIRKVRAEQQEEEQQERQQQEEQEEEQRQELEAADTAPTPSHVIVVPTTHTRISSLA